MNLCRMNQCRVVQRRVAKRCGDGGKHVAVSPPS
jgi:hypothetical protein